jgi:predicted PurR-regulated permease PerM
MIAPRRAAASSSVRPMALLAGTVAVLYLARQVFIPLAIALTLAFLLAPLVAGLQKCRFGRVPAVIVVITLSGVAAGMLGWNLAGQLLNVLNDLPKYRENIHNKIEAFRSPQQGPLGKVTETVKDLKQELSSPDAAANAPTPPKTTSRGATVSPDTVAKVQIVEAPANVWQYLQDLASPLLAPAAQSTVVLIFTIVMLVKKEDLRNRLLRLAGVRQLNVMTEALDDAASRVSRYLFMQGLVNAVFGLVFGIGLYFVGVPNAALWGVLAATLRIVPYVGTMVAAAFPLVLSLAVFDTWMPPLLICALYAALELITANLIEPWLYGTHTGISPLAILVTTIFWAMLWGPAGLILSTPLTVCLVVVGRYVPQLSFLAILLGDQPVLGPEAQFYQRLLAMDQSEAREIADLFLKERPLIELYDSVLIPALALAEQDRHKGALDQAREEFLFLNIGEMIAEFRERDTDEEDDPEPARSTVRQSSAGRVICLPVNDEADQLIGAMLAQVLEQMGYSVISFPAGTSLSEISPVELKPGDVILTSAVPPFAFVHSKNLYKQLRGRFPDVRIGVGIWGFSGDAEKARSRFERHRPETILTSLAGAATYVAGIIRPSLLQPSAGETEQVGASSNG